MSANPARLFWRRGAHLVATLSTAMAGLAVWLWLARIEDLSPVGHSVHVPVVFLAAAFALAEVFVVHLHVRKESHTFSLSEIPLIVGLFFVRPGALIAARLLGTLPALMAVRRQPPIKLLFNESFFALACCVDIVVFHWVLGSSTPTDPKGWLAALAAAVVELLLGTGAITLAIAATSGRAPRSLFRGIVGLGALNTGINTNLALVTVLVLSVDGRAGWLLLGISGALFFAYRSHTRLRENHQHLEQLYEFTRSVGNSLEGGSITGALLEQARRLMSAEVAELCLPGVDGEPDTCVVLNRDEPIVRLTGREASRRVAARREVLGNHSSRVLGRGRHNATALATFGDDVTDAVLTTLQAADGREAILVVANHLSHVETFHRADQRLLDTLANHASVSLRNNRLVEQLRREVSDREHQALHDSLTDLPNRTLFDVRVRQALARPGENLVAVLLIDLDRFKEVNDTLGHHHGDHLLQEVGRRLVAYVEGDGLVARLGGDEFGVLLVNGATEAEVRAHADELQRRLEAVYDVADLALQVGASIGIALAPRDAQESSTLLQRADVAMYAAKSSSHRIEFYDPSSDHYSPQRLTMVTELRHTIERNELLVQYQPKADLRTGQITGVEALARWHHPVRGFVPPDEFIPIAEYSGLIRPLTHRILHLALRQCRLWRDEGRRLDVAVNLSVRSLLDDALPDEIIRALDTNNLPPSALVLEITESTIIADPARTIGVLNRLSAMGVGLAIDDFGTGYSSLSYLKRLPVDEIKIDKSFVINMANDDNDAVIVRSTVELARTLGLRVVAEGVEDATAWAQLQRLGCHLGQGYHLSRPLTSTQLTRWLREREADAEAASHLAEPAVPPLRLHKTGNL